jgi:hypothetical protein
VSFPCPGCDTPIDARPEGLFLRCPACGALVRSRPADASGPVPVFEVYVAGREETVRRVEVPWDEAQQRRLARWLLWSSVVTIGLVLVLYALARLSG